LTKMPPKAKMDAEKTPKAKKDPNAPKRARSAYILFSTEEGKNVRQANPKLTAPEVLKEVGRRWGVLDPKLKAAFEQKAAADKERYTEEMESYSPPNSPDVAAVDKKGKRAKKDPNAPKRAQVSSFIKSPFSFLALHSKEARAGNHYRRGRLSSVDLLPTIYLRY